MSLADRLKSAFSAFNDAGAREQVARDPSGSSYSSSYLQYRYSKGSILDTIITKIAIDVSMVEMKHVKKDGDLNTEFDMNSGLNRCFELEANIDQTAIEFKQDMVFSMMDEGVVAIVPTFTDVDPNKTSSYDIKALRVGKITHWYPYAVVVNLYNEELGYNQETMVLKRNCAIVQNPLYAIINGENATFKRLSKKLAQLDKFDDDLALNKLDIIVQMPWQIKGETRQKQAIDRVTDIQNQLKKTEYGIAYIDSQEHITQLNRPAENHLFEEIKALTSELYNQLGLTENIFNGTASEQELRSYYNRTINPIVKQIAMEFNRKFITDTGRTQGQTIVYYSDPFKLVPLQELASSAHTFKTDAILTSNEIRGIIGFKPLDDPAADQLYNPNITDPNGAGGGNNNQSNGPDENGYYYDDEGNAYDEEGNPVEVDQSEIQNEEESSGAEEEEE